MENNIWYSEKRIKGLGALFVIPKSQKMWTEFSGRGDRQTNQFTQLELLNFVTYRLHLRSSQVVKIKIGQKRFALICSDHEMHLDQGIKRGFAFVGLNEDDSLTVLADDDSLLLTDNIKIIPKQVNGYQVWCGVLGQKVTLDA